MPEPVGIDQRINVSEIAQGRITIRWGRGRVELGSTRRAKVRVRITGAPPKRLLRRGPEVNNAPAGLDISGPGGRLQVDLPEGLTVRVHVERGDVTSWGAGGVLDLVSEAGSITCRELLAADVQAQAQRVSLHFALAPQRVQVAAERATVSVPGGEYAVDGPPEAEVTVVVNPESDRRITVQAGDTRILASQAPLRLTDEAPSGS